MGNWRLLEVDVSKSWKAFDWKNKFAESLAALVKELESSDYYIDGSAFKLLVDDIATSKTLDEFNSRWNSLYDFCDANKIWIKTY